MREFTRRLKAESMSDRRALSTCNNSKWCRRTPEQRAQSRNDRADHYERKWSEYLAKAETPAQKVICEDVLEVAKISRGWA